MRQPIPSEVTLITSNSLGTLLDQIENLQGKIGLGYGRGVVEILSLMDRAKERVVQAQKQGLEIPSEQAQFSLIVENFRNQSGVFLREIGGVRTLEPIRQEARPLEENWWWWPERIVAQRRAVSAKAFLRTGAIIVAVLAVVVIAYQLFFKPDPSVIAAQRAIQGVQQVAAEGDLQKAIPLLDEGLSAAPNDAELLVLKGCVLSMIPGKEADAQVVFSQAEKLIANREIYLLQRAQSFYGLNNVEAAFRDAQQAVDLNPNSAKGYLILGQMLESQKEMDKAYAAYEKASNLATAQDDSFIAAQSRIKMGMVMQLMGVNSLNSFEITPTPTP